MSENTEERAPEPKRHSLAWRIGKIALKSVLYLLLFVIGLVLLVWVALQIPAVQQFAVNKVTTTLQKQLGTEVRIGKVDIDFFKTVVLEDIYLEDQQRDTLLYAGHLGVDIGVFALGQQTINVNQVELERAYVNLYREPGQEKFNYEFVMEAFASSDTTVKDTTASAWKFDLEGVALNQVRFDFRDVPGGNDLQTYLNHFEVDLSTLGLDEPVLHPVIDLIEIEGLNVAFKQSAVDTNIVVAVQANPATDSVRNDTMKTFLDGFALTLNKFTISNTNLSYDITDSARVAEGLDYNHLAVGNLALEINDVELGDSAVQASLDQFAFTEKNSGFRLNNVALAARGEFPRVEATLKEFRTPNSALTHDLTIALADFRNEEQLMQTLVAQAQWQEDYFGMQDALYFAPDLDTFQALQNRKLYLNGNLDIRDGNLSLKNGNFHLDDALVLNLAAEAEAYYDPLRAKFDLQVDPVRTDLTFIRAFLAPGTLPPAMQNLGEVQLFLDAQGYARDLQGNMRVVTNRGNLSSDFQAKMNDDFTSQQIQATLRTESLSLAQFLGDSSGLGRLTMRADVNVDNSPSALAVRDSRVHIDLVEYNDYAYHDLNLAGSFVNNVADARIETNDTNLRMNLTARAELTGDTLIVASGVIDTVDLYALNLYADTLALSTRLDTVRVQGLNPNTLEALIAIRELRMQKDLQRLSNDSLIVQASTSADSGRVISLNTDFMRATASGNFAVEELPAAMEQIIAQYVSRFRSPDAVPPATPQTLALDVDIRPNPSLIQAFVPGLELPNPLSLYASLSSVNNQVELDINARKIVFSGTEIDSLQLSAETQDDQIQLISRINQIVMGTTNVPGVRMNVDLTEDNFDFNLKIAGDSAPSRLGLEGRLAILEDTFRVNLNETQLFLEGNEWILTDNATIAYAPEYLLIRDFGLSNEEQALEVSTQLNEAGTNVLNVDLREISIGDIATLLDQEALGLAGRINGNALVVDPFALERVQADIGIEGLMLDSTDMGMMQLQASKSNTEDILTASLNVEGPQHQLQASGTYNVAQEENNLDFDIDMSRFRLDQFQPLLASSLKQIKGNLTADLKVTGSPSAPNIVGELGFGDSTVIYPVATGVPYQFSNQRVRFTGNALNMNNFQMGDSEGNKLTLAGNIGFADLTNPSLNLKVNTNKFKFLNSTQYEGLESFYGRLYALVDLSVTGTVADMLAKGRFRTLDESSVSMRLDAGTSGDVQPASYIVFHDTQSDTVIAGNATPEADSLQAALNTMALTGFQLDADVELTPGTQLNIYIDEENKVEAVGSAILSVDMTKQGDIIISGTYEIEKGYYAMNLLGVINKEFAIRKGSTIQLNGGPTDATVNLTAVYESEAVLYGLADQGLVTGNAAAAAKQKQPVNVLLRIQGEMLSPTIGFEIELPEETQRAVGDALTQRVAQINQNENQLFRQVFGLVVLNQVIPDNGYQSSSTTAQSVNEKVDETVSQVLTTQLSNLTEEYLGGVQVSVDVGSKQNAEGTYGTGLDDRQVGVNLSKQLFDDRLKVTVGSNVDLGGNSASDRVPNGGNQNVTNVIGDIVVEYQLLADGLLNVKFFRRTNQNRTQFQATNSPEVIGASLANTIQFESLRKLLGIRRPEYRLKEEEEEDDEALKDEPVSMEENTPPANAPLTDGERP
ncbi:Family of unknown function [Catalinimonas alkaloidigena]|uniref:FHA domain-containing protein n=1 Tax=Catalinimonas alkaloidigena TaxID=1075417 RepID=A0A1G9QC74_9BACT|nr:translocation/assembly module TamB domain-containing protein [Catalinimonas alkaloidigena]SDM08579.1 Family of unknown function [Catalinimonas alkaloidigena]